MSTLLISLPSGGEPGLGVKLLHQILLRAGYDSHFLCLPRYEKQLHQSPEHLLRFVEKLNPSFVGIGLMAHDLRAAQLLTKLLKEKFPDTPLIWGGIHVTSDPEDCLHYADYACVGEADTVILDLAEACRCGTPLTAISNLCYLRDGEFIRNPLAPLVEDLDSLPVPLQIPPQSYYQAGSTIEVMTTKHLSRYSRHGGRVYRILTSRGCPMKCTYCCNHLLRKRYGNWPIRRRSIGHIIKELEAAIEAHPAIDTINVQDDYFLTSQDDFLKEFLSEFRRRIGTRLITQSTPIFVTEERVRLLKEAGLTWFNMGLQSGSTRTCQEVYKRSSDPERFLQAARLLRKHHVAVWYDILVDNPFETTEDRLATLETLIHTPKPFYAQVFSLIPYRGTALYERALKEYPEWIGDLEMRNYAAHFGSRGSHMVELAAGLPAPIMRLLLRWYRKAPTGRGIAVAIAPALLIVRLVLNPLHYFQLLILAEQGSLLAALSKLPAHLDAAYDLFIESLRLGAKRY